MQGFKKSLVALLAVAMVLSLVGTAFAAPADVAGTKYEDAAVRLIALGVFKGDDKGNFNPENPITRAEAAAVIIRALGLEKSADLMKGVTKFADVNADPGLQWATGAINVAVSSEIVNGYPNGQFGGRDNVTYAQLAKMILYALNYGVTVEGGVWPTAVLAKADDLDILDGMTVVADAPITRGDAAKMLDNSLDVASLKQTGYGDLKQFEETGKTLLERMGLDEIEGRVVEIPEVQKALDDDEVVIAVTKENGDKVDKKETYAELAGVDAQGLFGLKVRAWVKDDEIVFVENKTAANDVYTDTVKGTVKDNKVDLVVLDDDVTFAEKATVYVNYEKAKVADLKDGFYGRFVQDKNEIVFASVFNFGSNEGVVTKVDGKRVKYFLDNETERTLNLIDADSITVFNADLTKATFEDIEEDNVISWWKSSDDYYIVVNAVKVEGKLEKIRSDKVTIDGKGYTFKKADKATYSLDEDKTVTPWNDTASDIDDLDGEEVVALFNLKGHVRHLRGFTGKTSGTQYGIVTASPSDSKITVFTKDGEEVTYGLDKRTDWGTLKSAPAPDEETRKYYGAKESLGYYIINYKLNADGMIAESKDDVGVNYAVQVYGIKTTEEPIEFDKFDVDASSANSEKVFVGNVLKGKDDSFVKIGEDKFYVDEDTVVVRAVNKKGELEPEIVKWEDFKDLKLTASAADNAVVFGSDGKDAKAIFFVDLNFAGAKDDTFYGVVTDKPWKSGGKWYAEIDVSGKEVDEYKLSDTPDFAKGALVAFNMNAKGEAVVTASGASAVAVAEVDKNYIKISATWYKVDKDAVVYDLDKDNVLDNKLTGSDIEQGDEIFYLIDEDQVVKVVVIKTKGEIDTDLVKATVIKDVSASGATVTVILDVNKGDDIEVRLYNNEDKLVYFEDEINSADDAPNVDVTLTATSGSGVYMVKLFVDGVEAGSKLVNVTIGG